MYLWLLDQADLKLLETYVPLTPGVVGLNVYLESLHHFQFNFFILKSYNVAQDSLKLMKILLPLAPEC